MKAGSHSLLSQDSVTRVGFLAWLGLAWLGLAWLGLAWLGLAWLGLAWLVQYKIKIKVKQI
jgi:hypothetical protein